MLSSLIRFYHYSVVSTAIIFHLPSVSILMYMEENPNHQT